jgi:hypothetical protein
MIQRKKSFHGATSSYEQHISTKWRKNAKFLPALFVETHLVLCIEKLSGTVS